MPRQPKPWRRGGGPWYSQVDGRKVWLAPADATKTEAQEELYRQLAGRVGPARERRGRLTAKGVFDFYLEHTKGQVGRGERTGGCHDVYQYHLMLAAEAFGAVPALSVLPRHVLDWVHGHEAWGPTTRSTAIKIVKAAFNWAASVGHMGGNPLAGMARPGQVVREAVPTVEQADAILARFADEPTRDLLTALKETGCRPREVYTLTADRVDVEAGTWRVLNKTRRQTGEATRVVHLSDGMVALSRRLLGRHPEGVVFRNNRGTPWTRMAIANRLWRMRTKEGMGREANAYAFRHFYATQALVNGVPVATVATLLGHKKTDMVMSVYSKLGREKDHMREAARRATGEGRASPPPAPPPGREPGAARREGRVDDAG